MSFYTYASRIPAWITLGILYSVAWGTLLLSVEGVWWDDWMLLTGWPDGIVAWNVLSGLPGVAALHVMLVPLGPVAYHLLSFGLLFGTGLALYGILRTVPTITPRERLFVAALFLTLPLYAARNSLNVMQYTLSLFLFYVAWYLLVRTVRPGRVSLVVVSVMFLISFTMNSLLVFYLVPMAHLWWKSWGTEGTSLVAFVKARWSLLILPFIFFGIKLIWFTPSGPMAGYNSISRNGLIAAIILLIIAAIPLLMLLSKRNRLKFLAEKTWVYVFGGGVLIVLAVFPYMAVGHYPPYSEWRTRDEILMPLGVALMILGIARLMDRWFGRKAGAVFATGVIVLSIVLSARIGLEYWIDWRKQQIVIAMLSKDDNVREGSLIVFQDKTVNDNIFNTPYRFYAWNGLLVSAFGDARRLGLNVDNVADYLDGGLEPYFGPGKQLNYGAANFQPTTTAVIVTIAQGVQSGEYALSSETVLVQDLPTVLSNL